MTDLLETIRGCQKRDARAERALFDAFAPKVFAVARRYAPDAASAEDFFQEIFLKIFSNVKKYDPVRGDFGGWLHRIAVNTCLLELRNRKRNDNFALLDWLSELPENQDDTPEFFPETTPEDLLLDAIRQLPDGYRQVLNLSVFEKMPHRDIAQILGIAESTSRSQLARALHFIKNVCVEKNVSRRDAKTQSC